jgi:hypothetical protein
MGLALVWLFREQAFIFRTVDVDSQQGHESSWWGSRRAVSPSFQSFLMGSRTRSQPFGVMGGMSTAQGGHNPDDSAKTQLLGSGLRYY